MKIKDNIKKLYEKLNDRINTTHTYSYFGRIYLYLLEEYRDEKKMSTIDRRMNRYFISL